MINKILIAGLVFLIAIAIVELVTRLAPWELV